MSNARSVCLKPLTICTPFGPQYGRFDMIKCHETKEGKLAL
jgi:hypothetical protein